MATPNTKLRGALGLAAGSLLLVGAGCSTQTASYKDGTYTALGDYTFHSGSEEITVGVTLKNNVITDATFTGVGTNPMSQKFMGKFESGYKALVIGQNIDDVHLDKVSGSSRTPIGFNDALTKIKAQAKSS